MPLSSIVLRPTALVHQGLIRRAVGLGSTAPWPHYTSSSTAMVNPFISSLTATTGRFTSTGIPEGQDTILHKRETTIHQAHDSLGLEVTIPPSQVVEANTVPAGFLGPRRAYLRMNRIKAFGEWDCQCGAINCGDRTDCFECGRPVEECRTRVHQGGGGTPGSTPNTTTLAENTPAQSMTNPATSTDVGASQCPADDEYIRRDISVPGRGSRGGAWRPSRGGSGSFAPRGRGTTPVGAAQATATTPHPAATPGSKPSPTFNPANPKVPTGAATPGAPRVWTPAGNNPGDWKCPCGANNFSYRKTCFKCSKAKPLA